MMNSSGGFAGNMGGRTMDSRGGFVTPLAAQQQRTVVVERVPKGMVDLSMWDPIREKITPAQMARIRYQKYISEHFFFEAACPHPLHPA